MTEAEWFDCDLPHQLVTAAGSVLVGRRAQRLYRLILCACARRALHNHPDERILRAVEAAELFADDRIATAELDRARDQAIQVPRGVEGISAYAYNQRRMGGIAINCARRSISQRDWIDVLVSAAHDFDGGQLISGENEWQVGIIRDVFGNPYRPRAANPLWARWAGGEIVRLARGIYDVRDFEQMPILADALEEAGADAAVLEHLRGSGPHARGCWVLDLVLDKS